MMLHEEILRLFKDIKQPLSKSAVCGTSKSAETALKELIARGEIINFSNKKNGYELLTKAQVEDMSPLKVARKAITGHIEGAPRLVAWSKKAQKKLKIPAFARRAIPEALQELKDLGFLVVLKSRSVFLISSKALIREIETKPAFRELVSSSFTTPSSRPGYKPVTDRSDLIRAYKSLLHPETGMTMVSIGKLQEFLKWPIGDVQKELEHMNQETLAEFPRGDTIVLSETEKEAGFFIERIKETVHYVRLTI